MFDTMQYIILQAPGPDEEPGWFETVHNNHYLIDLTLMLVCSFFAFHSNQFYELSHIALLHFKE